MKKFFCPLCLIGLILVLVVLAGYSLLKGGYRAPDPTPTPPAVAPSPEVEVPSPEVPTAEVREITVSGTEFSFSPSSITVSAGGRVKITFRNIGGASHNLVVEGLGVSTNTIGGGQQDILEFTAPASGTYTFFCSVPGHRAAGMVGNLIVE